MSAVQFVFDTYKVHAGDISLTGDTIKAALLDEFVPTYSAWVTGTAYSEGDIIIPTTRNGRRYRATTAGTSGTAEPTWPTATGGTVVDGGVTWEEYGGEHADNEFFNAVSANEVAATNGYTAGGELLGTKTVALNALDPINTEWDAADTTWTALTKSMRHAVLYVDGATPGTDDYLISYILLDDTPADISVSGVDFTLQWSANGILVLGR